MPSRTNIALICALIVGSGLAGHASVTSAAGGAFVTPGKSVRNAPKSIVVRPGNPTSTLRIMNVRLETPPADAPRPAAVLKFDMVNDGDLSVTDIVIQITMLEKPRAEHVLGSPRFIVKPFTIQGSVTLDAGYTVNYEMLLRNLSAACECVPKVVVMSARQQPEPS
jgi:hypothetical protein